MEMNQIMRGLVLGLMAIILIGQEGCTRGEPFEEPPIHVNPNMDVQPKYKAQRESRFFADGSADRLPVPGTVARDAYHGDKAFSTGKDAQGKFITLSPLPYSENILKRGQQRFNIYCAPCHSKAGDGKGIVVQRGFLPPPTFHQKRIRDFKDGHIFNIISNGYRNMPSYRHQIPVQDRWAIVGYVRVLQRSQNASIADIPENLRKDIK